jgi:hypothetical protein
LPRIGSEENRPDFGGKPVGIDSIDQANREELIAQIATLELENRGLRSAASLLDVEFGVEYEVDSTETEYIGYPSEAEARAAVAESPTDTGLRQRLVSAWIPVE